MNIAENCMIVNLTISAWSGYKLDRGLTHKVTAEAQADTDAARVNKHLVPKESLKEIVTAMGALRTHFYEKTLPWGDNGDRLLPRLAYQAFIEEHGRLCGDFDSAVDNFLNVKYPAARDRASFRMGEMFKASDYPEPSTLKYKFAVNLDVHGVPTGHDFRVDLAKEDIDLLRVQIDMKNQDRVTNAIKDVWVRLLDTLGHFAARMDGDAVFRDSTVTNLEELVDAMPALNITNDPELEKVRQDIMDTIIGFKPKDLRKDDVARRMAAKESKRIVDQMQGFMSAFGG